MQKQTVRLFDSDCLFQAQADVLAKHSFAVPGSPEGLLSAFGRILAGGFVFSETDKLFIKHIYTGASHQQYQHACIACAILAVIKRKSLVRAASPVDIICNPYSAVCYSTPGMLKMSVAVLSTALAEDEQTCRFSNQ